MGALNKIAAGLWDHVIAPEQYERGLERKRQDELDKERIREFNAELADRQAARQQNKDVVDRAFNRQVNRDDVTDVHTGIQEQPEDDVSTIASLAQADKPILPPQGTVMPDVKQKLEAVRAANAEPDATGSGSASVAPPVEAAPTPTPIAPPVLPNPAGSQGLPGAPTQVPQASISPEGFANNTPQVAQPPVMNPMGQQAPPVAPPAGQAPASNFIDNLLAKVGAPPQMAAPGRAPLRVISKAEADRRAELQNNITLPDKEADELGLPKGTRLSKEEYYKYIVAKHTQPKATDLKGQELLFEVGAKNYMLDHPEEARNSKFDPTKPMFGQLSPKAQQSVIDGAQQNTAENKITQQNADRFDMLQRTSLAMLRNINARTDQMLAQNDEQGIARTYMDAQAGRGPMPSGPTLIKVNAWAAKNNAPALEEPLAPQALDVLRKVVPVRKQMEDMMHQLEALKDNNTPGYFFAHRAAYGLGAATDESGLISQGEMDRILGGARILAGSTRSQAALEKAGVHLPSFWKDSPKLQYEKLKSALKNVNDVEQEAHTYGNKFGRIHQGSDSGKSSTETTVHNGKQATSEIVRGYSTRLGGDKAKVKAAMKADGYQVD